MPSINLEYIFYILYTLLTGFSIGGLTTWFVPLFFQAWSVYASVAAVYSMILFFATTYAIIREHQLRHDEVEKYDAPLPWFDTSASAAEQKNERWLKVVEHVDSDRPADWRLAIIEADILLDEMVKRMGYDGDTLGERLKRIEKSDFTALDQAWEAHKIRNLIAHEGSDFVLTQREARRVIDLYKQVFEEFRLI